MRKLPVIIAAAFTLSVVPALAQTSSQPSGGGHMNREFGGKGGLGSSMGEGRSYGGGRTYGEGEIRRHGEGGWRGMREGCKYVTVRQRQGDEVIIRHFKRCD